MHALERLGQLLCLLGHHDDEPVIARPGEPYVLLRCQRCGRDLPLIGQFARLWLERHYRAD